MSELLSYELKDNIAVITLNNGKVNAISPQLIEEFNAALDAAEQSKSVVVITGTPGMLSGGYDLKVMTQSMESAMALVKQGSTLSHRLLSFPMPVIVACPGHAVAKGAFLLLSADLRIGVEGPYKIGLNEVAIGMTMHHAGISIARARLAPVYLNRCVINAEMFAPQQAKEAGFLDIVVEESELMARAMEEAKKMTALNLKAHKNTKLKVRSAFLSELAEAIEKDATGSL
ncbi:crotonase/enoyl-CoA hydratase family protein [Hahella sp. KA22]|uniref:crotonase/enoyl-CoA hydratase family protein n=1 Tax=Hahella sp. KA22 TaxID=1628392 RepID=UPI000FDE2C10|nr:crotonase/enoyl-CoA hydratase family protein [Hahella sp. KA22]AZZ93851.1 crotonase/enoyl-CoA hydratase family protein [Hahella sp. KA22]QAY57224.1 crotonase/enoyl-CoA hydratase family protein [Hahella sp. KA22]